MRENVKIISNLVKEQFPAFYKEEGEAFILFLKTYYEWLEQEGGINNLAKSLPEIMDIDTTPEKFLSHFKNTYMRDLPEEIIGNQRLFQKHILELYRSKGSEAGLKLLFRLLFDEDIDIYIPSYDIFTTSDGVWMMPKYIEVSYSTIFDQFTGKAIYGFDSGAKAVVESIETKYINGYPVHLIKVSNVAGNFRQGEIVTYDGNEDHSLAPIIMGSPVNIEVFSSTAGFNAGEILIDTSYEFGRAKPLRAVVAETYDSVGIIQFSIIDGGDYYSREAIIEVTSGANTSGIGASCVVYDISNEKDFKYSTEKLITMVGVALNADPYGFNYNPTANSTTLIDDSVGMNIIKVGKISVLATTNPGTGYDDYVNVKAIDPYTSTRGIWIERNNGWGGLNAQLSGVSITGKGLIKKMRIHDAGYGYNTPDTLTMISETDPTKFSLVTYEVGGLGEGEGYFDDTKSFTSSDKYLFDGHYYQYHSYVIKTSKALEKFLEILYGTVHMAGNRPYAQPVLKSSKSIRVLERNFNIEKQSYVPVILELNFIENSYVYRTKTTHEDGKIF